MVGSASNPIQAIFSKKSRFEPSWVHGGNAIELWDHGDQKVGNEPGREPS